MVAKMTKVAREEERQCVAEVRREKRAVKKAATLVRTALKRPVHLRVPVTKARAEQWLAQRNALGRVLYELITEPDDHNLELLIEHIRSAREELESLEERVRQHVEQQLETRDIAYEVLMRILSPCYEEEGYNPFSDDLDERWEVSQ